MEKVKVIEFIQSMGDGGAETLVKDYALLMDKERFDVTVVVQHALEDSANLRRLKAQGIPVIALSSQDDILKKIWRRIFWEREETTVSSEDVKENPVLPGDTYEDASTLRKIRNYARNLYFGIRFLKVWKQTGATVIHGHLDVLCCLQAIGGFLKGVRLLHTCHALPELIYAGEEGKSARRLIRSNGLQMIALHQQMAEEMDEMFPEQKTLVFRNGIDLKVFQDPGVSRDSKRCEIGIPTDVFLVGHVGRFTPEKNHGFLVEVFREIASRRENAFLLMIGAGSTEETERKLKEYGLGDQYLILSHRQDIPQLLATMDVFVFPSIFEGFGIALLEAQAAGLRCISSDHCPAEVIRTEHCISMPLENPEQWAEAALDPDWKRAESRALADYDMNREIRRLEALYLQSGI